MLGFIEAFAISRFLGTAYQSPPPYPFEIVLISNEVTPSRNAAAPAPVKSANGPRVAPDIYRDQSPTQPFDLLMIPGGNTAPLLDEKNPKAVKALVAWVRAMDERVKLMTSVCTGAAVLARAGLLDGKSATTNHNAFAWVTQFGPAVLWDNVSRWVAPAVTSPPRACRRVQTWPFIWSTDWRAGPWQRRPRRKRNMTGTATLKSQSTIHNRRNFLSQSGSRVRPSAWHAFEVPLGQARDPLGAVPAARDPLRAFRRFPRPSHGRRAHRPHGGALQRGVRIEDRRIAIVCESGFSPSTPPRHAAGAARDPEGLIRDLRPLPRARRWSTSTMGRSLSRVLFTRCRRHPGRIPGHSV